MSKPRATYVSQPMQALCGTCLYGGGGVEALEVAMEAVWKLEPVAN